MVDILPPEWPQDLLPDIRSQLEQAGRKLVVLDDDPTGTQTVHDIPVLTQWTVDLLANELQDPAYPAFFILSNSRSMPASQAAALNQDIAVNLRQAAQQTTTTLDVVSRSDSTLRGHFPLEIDVLREALPGDFDGCLLAPFFAEGGRWTLNDTHYIVEDGNMTPVSDSPFAQDRVFGYQTSNLRDWVEEKTQGRISAAEVATLSLDTIRGGGPPAVMEHLMRLQDQQYCVVNAASLSDLHVVVAAVKNAQSQGRHFLFRTAASFVQAWLGLASRPLLQASELTDRDGKGGGLTLVGSYVPKTSAQLRYVMQHCAVEGIELDVGGILDDAAKVLEVVVPRMNMALRAGRDVVVYTSRDLVAADDAEANLAIGSTVSQCLIALVHAVEQRPRYILAKGGITSSDIATQGLQVRRALVLGQVTPGVPVWRLGGECRFPGLAYIVFPGNVGGERTLADVIQALR